MENTLPDRPKSPTQDELRDALRKEGLDYDTLTTPYRVPPPSEKSVSDKQAAAELLRILQLGDSPKKPPTYLIDPNPTLTLKNPTL